ncbi:MAG: YjbH domain-containing protein, partial [Pseudomonadota bacterium]
DYEVAPGLRFGAYSLHGSQFGILLNFVLNPNEPPAGAGFEPAPVPIQARPRRDSDPLAWSEDWIVNQPTRTGLNETIRTALEAEGVRLDGIVLRANSAEVRIRNDRWRAEAQAHGRTLRVLARFLPASVERITVVPVVNSVPVAAVTYNRSDIERLGNAPGRAILDAAEFSGGGGRRPDDLVQVDPHPKLTYGVAPYLEISLFDPDDPLRYNVGVSFTGALEFAPGLVVSGEVRQPLFGTFDEISRPSNSELPRVRSNFRLYIDDNAPDLNNLQVAWYARPGDQFYSRISAGMLERMFGGVSAELLWKPIDSRIALGAEINYVQQREFDDPFAFQDYDVWTGHASIYYDLENGYFGQIDAGRYLAGDYGATFTAARVFDNGWRVSAYATFTNVPFEEFGEGSFDKGIRVTVPVDWLTGQPTRRTYTTLLQPLTRDGGARLNVPDRLYDRVRLSDQPALEDRAGRFWR